MARREDEPTPALLAVQAARAAYEEAVALVPIRRAELLDRMVEAASVENPNIARIARYAGYEAAYVRRQVRLRGVAAKQPTRKPPPGYKAKVETADAE